MRTLFIACVLAAAFSVAPVKAESDVLRQAKVMTEAGRFKEAVSLLKTYVTQDSAEELDTLLVAGKIYLALDRSDRALDYFEQAYEQDMDNVEAALGAATASAKLGRFTHARQYLSITSDSAVSLIESVYLQAVISLRTGDVKNAQTLMLDLTKQQPDSSQAAIANARFLCQMGDNQAALHVLKQFVSSHVQDAQSHEYLGELEYHFGNQSAGLQLKQAAYDMYDRQANAFKRDVVAAWLAVNRSTSFQAPKPPATANQHMPKEVINVEPVVEKTPVYPVDKPVKQAKANVMPSANDKEFSPPLLRFPFPEGVTITGGSGFIVDGGRKIVTNRHVIEGGKAFAIRTGLGEVINAKLIYTSSSDDLAVLELDKPLPPDRSIAPHAYSKPRVGRSVVVMGYPLWFILGQGSPSLTNGMVSKRTGMGDDQATFQLTAKVNKGNSGGPVFDMAGNVVGITVGKLDTKKIQDEQGFLPEDVNFAIHVDRLPALINASFESKSPNTTELTPEELYQVMLGKVVMVATYK